MRKFFLLVIFISVMMIFPSVMAHPPTGHVIMTEEELNDPRLQTSPFYSILTNNRAYTLAGVEMIDMAVPSYILNYVTGTGVYGATHNSAFVTCLISTSQNDQEKAISIGAEIAIIQDSVMHGIAVPDEIRRTSIQNIPMHPLYELGWESVLQRDNPYAFAKLQNSLKPILNDPQIVQWINNCLNKQPGVNNYDTLGALKNLDTAYGSPDGFFKNSFSLPDVYKSFAYGDFVWGIILLPMGIGLIFVVWKLRLDSDKIEYTIRILSGLFGILFMIGGILFLTGGIARYADTSKMNEFMTQSNERVIWTLQSQNWDKRTQWDGTGFSNLKSADASAIFVYYLVGGLVVFLVAFLIYMKVRK